MRKQKGESMELHQKEKPNDQGDFRLTRKTGLAHFCAAFRYSMAGLRLAVHETAVRHELCLGVVHFVALAFVDLGWLVGLVLSAFWAFVVVIELLNTAIEAVVDLASPRYHELAGRAKDLGSAAVLLALTIFFCSWATAIVMLFTR